MSAEHDDVTSDDDDMDLDAGSTDTDASYGNSLVQHIGDNLSVTPHKSGKPGDLL